MTTLVRWDPSREVESLHSEMNRLFDSFFGSRPSNGVTSRRWVPAIDLVEGEDHFVLKADLPGLTEADVLVRARLQLIQKPQALLRK